MSKGIYINDSIHGLIALSEYEKKIISSVGFNRLHDVYQNSTVYLTYPSNRTKRFEHSIGTMKLCSDMFFHSIENANKENVEAFYKLCKSAIEDLISHRIDVLEYQYLKKKIKKIPDIQMDSFRMSLVPRNVPEDMVNIHVILMEAVRVAALLHDIGHPPFSHVVERAMESVLVDSSSKTEVAWKDYNAKLGKYFPTNTNGETRPLHEVMGDEIAKSILSEIPATCESLENEKIFDIIVLHCVLKMYDDSSESAFSALHGLISGSVDGDRLDYVTRDPINSGINNGFIDYSRIILDMQMIMSGEMPTFCFPVKAVNAIEDFLKRRYDLYKKIVFHHRVIKTDYLLEHSVANLISSYLDSNASAHLSTPDSIPFDISGLWYPLGDATYHEKGDELSQWNDSWLMTVLKKIYFNFCRLDEDDQLSNGDSLTKDQLAELLRHEKSYYSLIKRGEDFRIIDETVSKTVRDSADELKSKAEILDQTARKEQKQIEKEEEAQGSTVVNIAGTLEAVNGLIRAADNNSEGFLISYIYKNKGLLLGADGNDTNFKKKIEKIVTDSCNTLLKSVDTITVFKKISTGTDQKILFYDSNNKTYVLDDISGVGRSLLKENDFQPTFYIYTFSKDNSDSIVSKKQDLLRMIGEQIGGFVVDDILQMFISLKDDIKSH